MATLEKIRSKSVLLFVIIIVALLAFILGDFLTSGRTYFGSGTKVAKSGNVSVDYEEYKNELESMQNQYQQAGQDVDPDELSQMVIQSLMYKNMLEKHYDKLGLKVTDAEITRAMTGAMPHPSAQQFIYQASQSIGLPEPNAASLLDAMNNPGKYNIPVEIADQLKAGWANIENNIADQVLYHKYTKLLSGLFQANNLDAKNIYDDLSTSRRLAYVAQPVNTVADDDVEVTPEDIKAQWEKRKERYALEEETRDVDYIYVKIEPSEADRMAGQKAVEDALMILNSEEGLSSVGTDRRFNVRRVSVPLSAVTDPMLSQALKNDTVGQATLFNSELDSYNIVKLLGTSTGVDSINISVLAFADAAMSDSLLTALESGTKLTDLINGQTVQGSDSVWTSLIAPAQFSAPVMDMLNTAETGKYYFVNDTTTSQSFPGIYRVNRRKPEVKVYDFALINYVVDPSSETLAELNNSLNTFLSANSSAEDFSAHALESGYSLLNATVSASTPHIATIPDSRQAVKWVMEAKKGKVSPIIRDNKQTYLMAIAVKDIYDGDYKPYTASDIQGELRRLALNAKKADKLVADYNGKAKDIQGYASLMESKVDTSATVFNAPLLLNLGANEGVLQGKIAKAEPGKLVGPVAGNNYVMVFEVLSDEKQGRPFEFAEFGARFRQAMGIDNLSADKIFRILKGDEKIKNNSLNFIQGLDD